MTLRSSSTPTPDVRRIIESEVDKARRRSETPAPRQPHQPAKKSGKHVPLPDHVRIPQ